MGRNGELRQLSQSKGEMRARTLEPPRRRCATPALGTVDGKLAAARRNAGSARTPTPTSATPSSSEQNEDQMKSGPDRPYIPRPELLWHLMKGVHPKSWFADPRLPSAHIYMLSFNTAVGCWRLRLMGEEIYGPSELGFWYLPFRGFRAANTHWRHTCAQIGIRAETWLPDWRDPYPGGRPETERPRDEKPRKAGRR